MSGDSPEMSRTCDPNAHSLVTLGVGNCTVHHCDDKGSEADATTEPLDGRRGVTETKSSDSKANDDNVDKSKLPCNKTRGNFTV